MSYWRCVENVFVFFRCRNKFCHQQIFKDFSPRHLKISTNDSSTLQLREHFIQSDADYELNLWNVPELKFRSIYSAWSNWNLIGFIHRFNNRLKLSPSSFAPFVNIEYSLQDSNFHLTSDFFAFALPCKPKLRNRESITLNWIPCWHEITSVQFLHM